MEKVRAPLDFIGINNYFRHDRDCDAHGSDRPQSYLEYFSCRRQDGRRHRALKPTWAGKFARTGCTRSSCASPRDYKRPAIEITENGCAYGDAPGKNGVGSDTRRSPITAATS